MKTPLLVSVPECCRLLGIKKTLAFAMMRSGELDRRKLHGRTLVTWQSVCRVAGIDPDKAAS